MRRVCRLGGFTHVDSEKKNREKDAYVLSHAVINNNYNYW